MRIYAGMHSPPASECVPPIPESKRGANSKAIKALDDNFGKVPNTLDYTTTNTVFSSGIDTLEGVPGILSPETDVILHKGEVARQDGAAVQAGKIGRAHV